MNTNIGFDLKKNSLESLKKLSIRGVLQFICW